MQTHLEPEQDHSDGQHGGLANRLLLIAGRHAAKLLQAVDPSLHLITLAIELFIKRPRGILILLPRDRHPNAGSFYL